MSTHKNEFTDEFVDNVLFGSGLSLEDYFVRRTPVSETVCYSDKEGQRFYLSIGNDDLMRRALERLQVLGVRAVDL
jgi:hypothetical protein